MVKYFSTLEKAQEEVHRVLADGQKHTLSTASKHLNLDGKDIVIYGVETPDPIVKNYRSVDDYIADTWG